MQTSHQFTRVGTVNMFDKGLGIILKANGVEVLLQCYFFNTFHRKFSLNY